MTLYDHCFSIINTYHKNYTEGKSKKDLSSFSPFMINKVLSMDYDLIDICEYINPHMNTLSDDDYAKCMSSMIPKGRYKLTYRGKKKSEKYDQSVEYIAKAYRIPIKDAEEYYDELSDEQIEFILNKYGISNE